MFADGQLGASFFCSRDFEDRSNLHFIFPTLAVQLARKYAEFRSILVPLAQSDPGVAYESLYHQMDKLIVEPLRECGISTVIIIDALDECKDDEPASAILSVLGQFVSEIPKVKFFLTGRPEPRIREGFRLPLLANATDIFVLHEVEAALVSNDIRRFLNHSFLEIAKRRDGLGGWPTEEQLDLLCERAGGLFIYAVATVKFIDNQNDNPRKRLDFLLRSPENSAHEGKAKLKMNTTLDSLCMMILQEAFGDDDPRNDPRIRSVLGAVILAANPLPPSTIAAFLGLDTDDVFPLLSSFHSLLILQQDVNHPVRSFHKSFPDFLVDPARCINPRFHVSPPDHHSELVIGCLDLMNRMLKKNMFGFPDGSTNDEADGLRKRAEGNIDHGLRYACESWHTHLVDANTVPAHTAKITSVLRQFLEQKFLFWLEVLSILGTVRNAVDALEVARKWLEVCQDYLWLISSTFSYRTQGSPAVDLVNDCFRFVTRFFEVISTSAAHIYHSALPLSPRTSIIRRFYEPYGHPLTRVVQGVPMSWDPVIVAAKYPPDISCIAWSPCSRFIAISTAWYTTETQILDTATLKRVKSLSSQRGHTWSLAFSAGGRLLARLSGSPAALTIWDLQTGVPIGTISPEYVERDRHYPEGSFYYQDQEEDPQVAISITYSRCETMLGVSFVHHDVVDIITYNVLSGTSTGHCSVEMPFANVIWTHDKHIRFATFAPGSITIWELGFVSEHLAVEVGSLPIPDNFDPSQTFLFLPTLSRLAFILENAIFVWDAQHSKLLLSSVGTEWPSSATFSSDGRFFACNTTITEFCLWKDSSTGYALHQKLISTIGTFNLCLSPDGRSITAVNFSDLQLWHTMDSTTPLFSVPAQAFRDTSFVLGFSPDESLAAVAMLMRNTATVLNLRSGVPQLMIDAGMKIYGLRVAERTVVVVGAGKIITWDLPQGDHALNATANTNNSIRTTIFDYSPLPHLPIYAAISSDFNYIAITGSDRADSGDLINIYDTTSGKYLTGTRSNGRRPWFTPDGCEIRCSLANEVERWAIIMDRGLNMKSLGIPRHRQEGCPWISLHGYRITDDGWILNSNGKRLLWLPPHWQSDEEERIWGGRFLALLHSPLPEAVILEVLEE